MLEIIESKKSFYEFFAGGGMVHQALGRTWSCQFANDFSSKKAAAYRANWGSDAFHLGDIQDVDVSQLPGQADLMWGSSPCQDVSLAGSQSGLRGSRSGMFWSFFDLVKGLQAEGREPRIVVLENVVGLVTSNKGADFASVCEAFASIGYRFGALILDASHWLPQSRPRFFLVAIAPSVHVPASITMEQPDTRIHPKNIVSCYKKLPDSVRKFWIWWNVQIPQKRLYELSDVIEADPRTVSWDDEEKTQKLLSMMTERHRAKAEQLRQASIKSSGIEAACLYRRTRNGIQRVEIRTDGMAGCLRTPSGGSSRQGVLVCEKGKYRTRLLSVPELAALMGLPISYKMPCSYNEAYHLAGDGVAVPVVEALANSIFNHLIKEGRTSSMVAA